MKCGLMHIYNENLQKVTIYTAMLYLHGIVVNIE